MDAVLVVPLKIHRELSEKERFDTEQALLGSIEHIVEGVDSQVDEEKQYGLFIDHEVFSLKRLRDKKGEVAGVQIDRVEKPATRDELLKGDG